MGLNDAAGQHDVAPLEALAAAGDQFDGYTATTSSGVSVLALFDGEPQTLAPGTELRAAMTRPVFIATGAGGAG